MEETSQAGNADDWLAGAMVEAGGEIGEPVEVRLEGLDLDEHNPLMA